MASFCPSGCVGWTTNWIGKRQMNKRKPGFNYLHEHGSQMTESSHECMALRTSEECRGNGAELWGGGRKAHMEEPHLVLQINSPNICWSHLSPNSLSLMSSPSLLQSHWVFFIDENLFYKKEVSFSDPRLSLCFLRITSLRFTLVYFGVGRGGEEYDVMSPRRCREFSG